MILSGYYVDLFYEVYKDRKSKILKDQQVYTVYIFEEFDEIDRFEIQISNKYKGNKLKNILINEIEEYIENNLM